MNSKTTLPAHQIARLLIESARQQIKQDTNQEGPLADEQPNQDKHTPSDSTPKKKGLP